MLWAGFRLIRLQCETTAGRERYYETLLKKRQTISGEAYLFAEFPTMKDVARIGPPDAAYPDIDSWRYLAYTPGRTETLANNWRLTDSGKRFGQLI